MSTRSERESRRTRRTFACLWTMGISLGSASAVDGQCEAVPKQVLSAPGSFRVKGPELAAWGDHAVAGAAGGEDGTSIGIVYTFRREAGAWRSEETLTDPAQDVL